MAGPILYAESLTKDYGKFRALDALNLAVQPGEIVGLLGPNGSGKSTALRLVLGFMRPSSGRCGINGFDSWSHGVQARKAVTYLPGELRLYENMTGRQLVKFLCDLRGQVPGEETDALARHLDIDIDRPLVNMSSGMKRKVALLQVLVPNVPLVILDEPTNALDPTMRDQLLEQLKKARDRGQAVLFSSHVLAEVEEVCDRVVILRKGKLAHEQTMSQLRAGRRVRATLAEVPTSLPDGSTLPEGVLNGGVLDMEYPGELPGLLEWLNSHGVTHLQLEPSGLGPIYRRIHGAEA